MLRDPTVENRRVHVRSKIDVVLFAGAILALGTAAWMTQNGLWTCQQDARYVCYFTLAWLAARLRVTSGGRREHYSMSFVFVIVSLVELNTLETLVIGACALLFNGLYEKILLTTRDDSGQMALNMVALLTGTIASHAAYPGFPMSSIEWPVQFVAASLVCFLAGNAPAVVVRLFARQTSWRQLLRSLYLLSFPYYIGAALLTALYAAAVPFVQWYATAAMIPLLLGVHWSFQRCAAQVDRYREQSKSTWALNRRTMEALAAAMERDDGVSEHLQRVQVYCDGIARSLGLSRQEREALQAAALLHDVGKLGVPDHIISKNGALTDGEIEKVRTHTVIGAGIVDRAGFPFAVAPIVRSHHEHWDGSGYPDGLKGEAIPIGARILAAVDRLDALVTSRPDRPGLSLENAVAQVLAGARKEFDPRVVKALGKKYRQFEAKVKAGRPAAAGRRTHRHLESIGAARSEMNALFQLHDQLSRALSHAEIAHALRTGFRDLVPYDALALYTSPAPGAKPDVVCGDRSAIRRARAHLTLDLPAVGEHACRMELFNLLAGRLTETHLRTAKGILPRLAQAIENVRLYQATTASASTDFLTQLPNAQSLFERLRLELDNARQGRTEVAVLICDLDGFKHINDTMGHLTGNRVLQETAKAFRDSTREVDCVARLGGDEFVIILPGLPESKVTERMAELRRAAREAGRRACGSGVIDASFGAARFPVDGGDSEELVAIADQRMYEEKRRRKNLSLPLVAEPEEAGERVAD